MKKLFPIRAVLFSTLLLTFATNAFADLVMIVNKENSTTLTKKNIVNIFLDKTNEFPNGATAVPIAQPENSLANVVFNKSFLKMDQNRLKRYWAKRAFSGRANPPKILADDQEVIDFVSRNASAIGYVDDSSVADNTDVRIVVLTK